MKHIALSALLLSFASTAFGAGYQLRYQGAETMGTAFASAGSYGDSLSSIYYNPGLFLMQDKDRAASFELMMIHPTKAEFSSATTSEDDFSSTSISGGLYYGMKIDDESAFTLAITTPWGTSTDYDSAWEGRYHGLETDLGAINVQPMLTKKVSDKFTFSIGPQIQYMTGALSSATATPVPSSLGGPDLVSKFDGSSWSVGGVLALTYLPSEKTTVGFNYTSQVKHKLRGDLDLTPATVAGAIGAASSKDAGAAITTPDVFTLGVSHVMSERLVGHFSASYTNWSLFKTLPLDVSGTVVSNIEQNWDDTYMLALGATMNMSDTMTLRGGVSYETGAVDNKYRTPRSQDTDRIGLGFGASFPIGGVNLDLALNHIIYTGDIEMAIPSDLANGKPGVAGEYDTSATLLRVGVEYVF